jgi:hypothetical protein
MLLIPNAKEKAFRLLGLKEKEPGDETHYVVTLEFALEIPQAAFAPTKQLQVARTVISHLRLLALRYSDALLFHVERALEDPSYEPPQPKDVLVIPEQAKN